MVKISDVVNLPKDNGVTLDDYLLGTDINSNLKTKNFTLRSIFNLFEILTDGSNTSNATNIYKFSSDVVFTDSDGIMNTNLGETSIADIDTLNFSRVNSAGTDMKTTFEFLDNNKAFIKIRLLSQGVEALINIYTVLGVTEVLSGTEVVGYTIDLELFEGLALGGLTIDSSYILDLLVSGGKISDFVNDAGYITEAEDNQTLAWTDGTKTMGITGGNSVVITGFSETGHTHSAFDRATSTLSGATIFSDLIVTGGITTGINTRELTLGDLGYSTTRSVVGITGIKTQFNTALTDGDFMFIGDEPTAHTHLIANITDYTGVSDADKYTSWNLKTGGIQRLGITSGQSVDFVAGVNMTVTYGAGGVVNLASDTPTLDTTNLIVAPESELQAFAEKIDHALLHHTGTGVSTTYISTVAVGGTTFAQPEVSGEIHSDQGYFHIDYAGATGITVANLTASSTYVYIDKTGALQQQTTTPTRQDWSRKIFTMRIGVDTSTQQILGFEYYNNPIGNYSNSIRDLYSYLLAQGIPFKKDQIITGRTDNLGFDISAGSLLEFGGTGDIYNPNIRSFDAGANVSYTLLSRTAVVGTYTDLIKSWDNNTAITLLGSTTCVGHRVFRFSDGNIVIQYGQGNYANMTLAKAGVKIEEFVLNPKLKNATFMGWWLLEETATATSGTVDAEFVEYSIGIQGGSSSDLSGCLLKGNNLSDLLDAATARQNIGLDTTVNQTDSTDKRFMTDAQESKLDDVELLSGTINEIAYFDSATTISSLAVATYPSLTELSYVKGVTSGIQAQLNSKEGTITRGDLTRVDDTNVTLTLGGIPTNSLFEDVSLTLGWSGLLSAARGGTGLNSISTLLNSNVTSTTLGLVIGTDVLAYDSEVAYKDEANTFALTNTFTLDILAANNKGLDVVSSAGTDVLNIGTINADTINIGSSSSTINLLGTVLSNNVTNLEIADKLVLYNKGGGLASGGNSGFSIEELVSSTPTVTGWFTTVGTRDGWELKAPANAYTAVLSQSGLTANRTYTLPDATGILALTSNILTDTDISNFGYIKTYTDTDTVYTHPTGDGNLHVIATSTTNNGKVLTAGATAGSLTWTDKTVNTDTVYTHPTKAWVDKTTLATNVVISNLTIDSLGHPTDWTTRAISLADLGYTGATNANYITNNNQLTNGAGYTGDQDLSGLAPASGSGNYIQNQSASAQSSSSAWLSGILKVDGTATFASSVTLGDNNWLIGGSQGLVRSRAMGYSSTYTGMQVGVENNHIALFIDPNTIAGGAFAGNLNELMLPNKVIFQQANSAGTDWLNGQSVTLNNGNVLIGTTTDNGTDKLQVNGSATIASSGTFGGYVDIQGVSGNGVNLSLTSGTDDIGFRASPTALDIVSTNAGVWRQIHAASIHSQVNELSTFVGGATFGSNVEAKGYVRATLAADTSYYSVLGNDGSLSLDTYGVGAAMQFKILGTTKFTIANSGAATFASSVDAATYYKSSTTSAVLGVASSGEVLLRPTAWNSSTAQSSFTTTLATIGTDLQVGSSSTAARLTLKQTAADSYGMIIEALSNDRWLRMAHDGTTGIIETTYNASGGFSDLIVRTHSSKTLQLQATGGATTFGGYTTINDGLGVSKAIPAGWITELSNTANDGYGLYIRGGGTVGTKYIIKADDALGNNRFLLHDTGEAIFTSSVTATNFILSSDERLKGPMTDVSTDTKIKAVWKTYEMKSEKGQLRYGVGAQELEREHPEFVRTDDKGMKSVAYIDLLVAKIAELESRLKKAGI